MVVTCLEMLAGPDAAGVSVENAAGQVVSMSNLGETMRAMVLKCASLEAKKDLLVELQSENYRKNTVDLNVERVWTYLSVRAPPPLPTLRACRVHVVWAVHTLLDRFPSNSICSRRIR